MQWVNTKASYGWISIVLHWVAALGVLTMLTIGLRADALEEAHDRAGHAVAMAWHVSIGITLFVLLAAQVIQYYVQPQPTPPEQARPLKLLSWATHHLLLLAVLMLIFSGPLMILASGHPIRAWGGAITIPTPFAVKNEALDNIGGLLHAAGRYMLYVLIPLHVLGALKHAVIDRDGIFARMLAPKRG